MQDMLASPFLKVAVSPHDLQDVSTLIIPSHDHRIDSDPLLLPFLLTCDDAGSQTQLTRLLSEHIEPLIRNIVGYKMRVFINRLAYSHQQQEAEDLYEEVLLQIIARLRHLKTRPHLPILKLKGYVAVVAYRACRKYMASLNVLPLADSSGRASEASDAKGAGHILNSKRLMIAGTTNFTAALEKHNYLQYIWKEIRLLPVPQRTAILLNLKDAHGTNLIALFPMAGIATFSEIAAVLTLTPARLAEIWVQLPLNDEVIAWRLSVTRQQVINLRKAGRRRLTRHGLKFIVACE
jgi:DNA-directed RNA polymerase specialized sigma24 family protein